MRRIILGLAAIAGCVPSLAFAQATTRQCGATEAVGPACLIARKQLPVSVSAEKPFWHIDRFPSIKAAQHARTATGTVAQAFGSTWLFTIAPEAWRPRGGTRVANIGPLPLEPAGTYAAEYLRSVFAPGMTAPLHRHSGPEAFFAVSGDTCLETPDGVQVARGPGNTLRVKGGPPMLLMAIGKVPRQGFALILHDADQPPTTLTQDWRPTGLCARQFAVDKGQ